MQGLCIKLGDRVGTIAWNTYRHFELYFGISGLGAVLHTLNPRLSPEHVAYIANHAEDKIIFVDLNLLPIVEGVIGQLKTVKHVVVMTDRAHMPAASKIASTNHRRCGRVAPAQSIAVTGRHASDAGPR